MLELWFAADTPPATAFDLNTFLSGGTGAAVVAALIFVAKLILDRVVPSRSDARANISIVLEGLQNMVKVLQDEKIADAKRLADKQARIEYLEEASYQDYDKIKELKDEIQELRLRLATKERHISVLVAELRRLGAQVTGLEDTEDEVDIEITSPSVPASVRSALKEDK